MYRLKNIKSMYRSSLWVFVSIVTVLLCQSAVADATDTVDFRLDESIKSIVEQLRHQGHPLAYSSDLLNDSLLVTIVPTSDDPIDALREVLAPHDLELRKFDNLLIIGKLEVVDATVSPGSTIVTVTDAQSGEALDGVSINNLPKGVTFTRRSKTEYVVTGPPGQWTVRLSRPGYMSRGQSVKLIEGQVTHLTTTLTEATPPIPEVMVFASHYEFLRNSTVSVSALDQQALNESPDLGNDPMRAIQRLPGVTSDGASARSFVRGGEEHESGIVLDGHRLLDPFHVRDYQSLFSAIDVRAVNAMEVFTGGFPVKYGNLNSSLVLVDSIDPELPRQTEIGLSVFNASILSAGTINDGEAQWVFSARRGNLDLVIDEELGEPRYHDVFGKLSVDVSPATTISANALVVVDKVSIITAADPDEQEEAANETRNAQFWITWDQSWKSNLTSKTRLSINDFSSDRKAFINDPEKIIGDIDDVRDVMILQLGHDWEWIINDSHTLSLGGEFQSLKAEYKYSSNVNYFGFFEFLPEFQISRQRLHEFDADGDALSVYASDLWQITDRLIGDIGFRWDEQNYTGLDDNGQFSPRLGVLYDYSADTVLRLSWGRYYQAHQIQELQVEDGVTNFFGAQRTDQWVLGIEHQLNDRYALRAEAFTKNYTQVRPRFENLFDTLTVIPELEADRTRLAPNKARAKGLELSVAYSQDDQFSWWANYTLSRSVDLFDGVTVPRSWDQRHALQMGLSWSGSRWNYSAAANVHSGWPKTNVFFDAGNALQSPTLTFGERNDDRYSPFVSVDMRVEYERKIRKGSLSWFLEISNITDRDNPCCVDYDLEEDEQGGLTLDKKEEFWFPILPATGVLWKF